LIINNVTIKPSVSVTVAGDLVRNGPQTTTAPLQWEGIISCQSLLSVVLQAKLISTDDTGTALPLPANLTIISNLSGLTDATPPATGFSGTVGATITIDKLN